MNEVYIAEYRTWWFPFWRVVEVNGHRYHPSAFLAYYSCYQFTLTGANENTKLMFRVRAVLY